jgi:hypothetical protein
MGNKEILLKIQNDRVWFNDTDFIFTKNTSIPIDHLKFRKNQDIFWKVQMLHFDQSSKKLTVEIMDYNCKDLDSQSKFIDQKPKKEIKYIEFGKFDWTYLDPQLSFHQKVKFVHQLIEPKKQEVHQEKFNNSIVKIDINEVAKGSNFSEDFTVDFNDSIFMLGYVGFSKYIKRLDQTIDFKIPNDYILSEFNSIKYWFSKKLKTKKFKVKATFALFDGELKEFSVTSREIDQINQNLIDGIKVQRTLGITKLNRPQDIDKALFTSDDLYSLDSSNDLEGNVFKQTEKDILDILIGDSLVRNKKQLTYLSGSKQSLKYRIRFTNHPNFGFIFLAEGELNNHFIWELLNSNATYIWTIGKGRNEIDLQYKRIEATINTILISGREKYKRAYRTANQDNDLILNVINHKDIGSQFKDDFPEWKYRLNELIT